MPAKAPILRGPHKTDYMLFSKTSVIAMNTEFCLHIRLMKSSEYGDAQVRSSLIFLKIQGHKWQRGAAQLGMVCWGICLGARRVGGSRQRILIADRYVFYGILGEHIVPFAAFIPLPLRQSRLHIQSAYDRSRSVDRAVKAWEKAAWNENSSGTTSIRSPNMPSWDWPNVEAWNESSSIH